MNPRRHIPVLFTAVAIVTAACVSPGLPRASETFIVELDPGESVEIVLDGNVVSVGGSFRVTLDPPPSKLASVGIDAELSSVLDGVPQSGWLDELTPLEYNVPRTFELVLDLMNTGSERRTEDFTVQLTVGNGEAGPLPEETSIELAVRESD